MVFMVKAFLNVVVITKVQIRTLKLKLNNFLLIYMYRHLRWLLFSKCTADYRVQPKYACTNLRPQNCSSALEIRITHPLQLWVGLYTKAENLKETKMALTEKIFLAYQQQKIQCPFQNGFISLMQCFSTEKVIVHCVHMTSAHITIVLFK